MLRKIRRLFNRMDSKTNKFQRSLSVYGNDKKPYNQMRKTKIVSTLGPSSWNLIDELIVAGVNVFRINFSHAKHDLTRDIVKRIRNAADRRNLGDLCGPKVRVNEFENGSMEIVKGEKVIVQYSDKPGGNGIINVNLAKVIAALQVGTRLLLDDGNMEIVVKERISDTKSRCEVILGGIVKSKKGLNIPNLDLPLQALTEKDRIDAKFILDLQFDYIALSFVQRRQDITDLRELIDEWMKQNNLTDEIDRPNIIAKIEKPNAIENLAAIVDEADGIMVARGDLGVECDLASVPRLQKQIIRLTKSKGKPVITATQMLETMIDKPVPTRAEVSDVAGAVYDGTDAVMLSGETASGKYPVATVNMMSEICLEDHVIEDRPQANRNNLAIANAAVTASEDAQAPIMVFTKRGHMVNRISQRKPPRRIIAITHSHKVARKLALSWGVYSVIIKKTLASTERILESAEKAVQKKHWLEPGTPLVFASGTHDALPGLNCVLRLTTFGSAITSAVLRKKWIDAVDKSSDVY